jgi:hypothetical protein
MIYYFIATKPNLILIFMKTGIISISIFFCLFACKENKREHFITNQLMVSESLKYEQDSPIITINQKEFEEFPFVRINEKIKNIHYIPFFSKEPVGLFDQIIIYDNRVIVMDAYKSEAVYIFDLSGNFINMIDRKGAGPEEYHILSDIIISKNDKQIVINDPLVYHMLYFTLDGHFVKKVRSAPGCYFEIYDDKIINQTVYGQSYSRNIEQNYYLTVAANDSIIRKGFPYYPIQIQAVNSKSLQYNYKNELLFIPILSDTVYRLTSDSSYTAKYVINHKKSIWQKKEEYLTTEQISALVKESGYNYLKSPVLETEKHVFYQINAGVEAKYIQSRSYWYDKAKQKSFMIKMPETGIKQAPKCIPTPIAIYGNYYVGIYLPHEIEAMIELARNKTVIFENEKLNQILHDEESKDMEFLMVMYELQ